MRLFFGVPISAFLILVSLIAPQTARAGDVHYSLLLGTPLNDQTYRNSSGSDYYTIVSTKRYSKFEYLVIPAPSCTNFLFPQYVKLATRLAKANTSGLKLLFYTRPVGDRAWQAYSIASTNCARYGTNAPAFSANILARSGLTIPAVDLEGLRYPKGVDVGNGIYNYLSRLAANPAFTSPFWVWNTAYAEKFQATTGQYFTTDANGNLTGNTSLPPDLIQQLGTVVWMDFHTMYAEHPQAPRQFIDQRLLDVVGLSGPKTAVQIGLTCLNGKVSLATTDAPAQQDQETMSTATYEGETVMIDAVTLAGIRNFNVYTGLANLKSPQWDLFYAAMNNDSTKFLSVPNISPTPNSSAGIAYGTGCLQE